MKKTSEEIVQSVLEKTDKYPDWYEKMPIQLKKGVPAAGVLISAPLIGSTLIEELRPLFKMEDWTPKKITKSHMKSTEILVDKLLRAGKRDPKTIEKIITKTMPKTGPAYGPLTIFRAFKNLASIPEQEVLEAAHETFGKLGIPPTKTLKDFILLPGGIKPSVAAHEIGHATGKLGKGLLPLSLLSTKLRYLPSLLAVSGALSSKEELPGYSKAAPYIGAGQAAAMLGEEARANIRGHRLLKIIGKKAPSFASIARANLLQRLPFALIPTVLAPLAILGSMKLMTKKPEKTANEIIKSILKKK